MYTYNADVIDVYIYTYNTCIHVMYVNAAVPAHQSRSALPHRRGPGAVAQPCGPTASRRVPFARPPSCSAHSPSDVQYTHARTHVLKRTHARTRARTHTHDPYARYTGNFWPWHGLGPWCSNVARRHTHTHTHSHTTLA